MKVIRTRTKQTLFNKLHKQTNLQSNVLTVTLGHYASGVLEAEYG
jgi:hypothetical protein